MAKPPKSSSAPLVAVRTRRAYFDCRFGQLHVRTAFPTTGGFDEGTTLFCLHPADSSSRSFEHFLPEIGQDRSVYAPDLPGSGESDPGPVVDVDTAAAAVADLAADLRLKQIDVLGFRFGAAVALTLAAMKPDLVRRLVLAATPSLGKLPLLSQESLVMRVKLGASDDSKWTSGTLRRAKFIDLPEYSDALFGTDAARLAQQIGDFLRAKA